MKPENPVTEATWLTKGVILVKLETMEQLTTAQVKSVAPRSFVVGLEAEVLNSLPPTAKNDLAMMIGSLLTCITSEE